MIKITRTNKEIKEYLMDCLKERKLNPNDYDMKEMVESFAGYVECGFADYIFSKEEEFFDCEDIREYKLKKQVQK